MRIVLPILAAIVAAIPAFAHSWYPLACCAVAGGLMSYWPSLADVHRLVGVYTGKILKGAKPADLPVQQAVKVELVLNLKTAKALGLTFPITLLGRADEVIEWTAATSSRSSGAQQPRGRLGCVRSSGSACGASAHSWTLPPPIWKVRPRFAAFLEGLQQLGWTNGRNVQIDNRWVGNDADYIRKHAVELVKLVPDVILASASITLVPLQQATRTIPIVFASAIDPVGAGLVASMARPGGNATGFVAFEYSMSAKWLELLKEIAPSVMRAAVLWEPGLTVGVGQLNTIRAAAPSMNMELSPIDVRDAGELESAVAEFARSPNGGLIVTGSPTAAARRALIIALADKYRLPAVYVQGYYVTSGGLISYAPSTTEPYWRAASYVDRILKGEKPADLPVQAPTKYELVINLKTAKALGLDVPPTLLARADEVIE
jgi:putative tryptophan/tyrosine transport system substrate-binding protein